jgi:ferredoxin
MTQVYQVELQYQGGTQMIAVPADTTILQAAHAAGIDLPTSCGAGVCTTCAAKILAGTIDQAEGMGVSPDLQAEGYALLCVAYPRSDLQIVADKEDELYELQFGRYQKA